MVRLTNDSQEAIEFTTRRALRLVTEGIDREESIERALDDWRVSLQRSQMIVRFNADLRSRGKPTLHVPLFEAAKIR